jgi:hypothetical protein
LTIWQKNIEEEETFICMVRLGLGLERYLNKNELTIWQKNIEEEETFICPAEIGYLRPLRALNDHGQWRTIVNGVQAHYETLSQVRLSEVRLG